MRIRNSKNKEEILSTCPYLIKDPSKYKGKFKELFKNDNPINLEIGMGKGNFIYNMALNNPNINFLGLEKYDSVITKAIKKIDKPLSNLYIFNYDAKNLSEIFSKEIDTIYLNFSDPWPKKRHAKRRLTSFQFLKEYDKVFKSKGHIILKTDNIDLFSYSIVSLSNYGYVFNEVSLDLHNTLIESPVTEYEEKFTMKGFKINYLNAKKK